MYDFNAFIVPLLSHISRSIYLNLPPLFIMGCITALTGVSVLAYFIRFHCDPILGGAIRHSNEVCIGIVLLQIY